MLQKIVQNTQREVVAARRAVSLEELKGQVKAQNYQPKKLARGSNLQIIAEVKPKSPSAGQLIGQSSPVDLAKTFANGGAAALSVLTDQTYFGGSLELLAKIRAEVDLPILRKDFVVDPYQIWQTRAVKADLILLIYKIIPDDFEHFLGQCLALDLQPLVEVRDLWEVEELWPIVQRLGAEQKIILGVNNRDLETFEVDWQHSLSLVDRLPKNVLKASLSGVKTKQQAQELHGSGFDFVLIGQGAIENPEILRF